MQIADCGLRIASCVWLVWASAASAQDSPSPTESPAGVVEPTATSTPAATRSVRISFVPPPLDGTISLGIYDLNGKLVRLLHHQTSVDEFTIGADALQTKWDGKDDGGLDLPAGKYHARGFTVGSLRVESVPADPAASPPPSTNDAVTVKLTANPLVKNDPPSVQLAVDFDDTGSFLKTPDELPLYVISERPGITSVAAAKSGEKSLDVWQESSAGSEHFRISKLDQMMAFDCGVFDLK